MRERGGEGRDESVRGKEGEEDRAIEWWRGTVGKEEVGKERRERERGMRREGKRKNGDGSMWKKRSVERRDKEEGREECEGKKGMNE